jgi:hypothetical protein
MLFLLLGSIFGTAGSFPKQVSGEAHLGGGGGGGNSAKYEEKHAIELADARKQQAHNQNRSVFGHGAQAPNLAREASMNRKR